MNQNIGHIPEQKRMLLEQLVAQLSQTPGVAAVVLGGSYASRMHHTASDMDIGVYYSDAAPFALADIRRIAQAVSVDGAPTVTGFYEWGAWVNGGAWVHTAQGKVDFLYRSLEHVRRTIDEAGQGILRHDYDQQPTHGFYSVTYLAETEICIPLFDPEEHIAALKRRIRTYPPNLKRKIIADALWSAEFTILHAREFASQGDIYNTAGCLSRALADMTQALFALNETYFMRYKKLMEVIGAFPLLPTGYVAQVNQILAQPGATAAELAETVTHLSQVWQSVAALPGVNYTPKFNL